MGHIFISYSHKDNGYVRKLERALTGAGFDVWIDERINYGSKWPKVIQENLDTCDAFVVVVSENSFASDWVQHEVTRAQRKGKPFFPLLLNGDPWLSIESTQYVDVQGEKLPPNNFYDRLEEVVVRRRKTNQSRQNLPNLPKIKSLSQYSDTKRLAHTSEKLNQQGKRGEYIPKPKGWAAVKASPVFRLGLVIILVGGLVGCVVFGFIIPRANRNSGIATRTPGPSPTYTLTVTAVGGSPQTQTIGTPEGPLSKLLEAPYTPTPLYVDPKRSLITEGYYRQFIAAYQVGDWDRAIAALQEVLKLEPDTVYAYYYLGEAYRFKGDPGNSQNYYNGALDKDPTFGAGYVGLARGRLLGDPNSNVLPLLDEAIRLDPNFGEAYLERGRIKVRDNDIQGALVDLGEANERMGDSPLVFFYLAQARLKTGELDLALNSARRANELDVTMLSNYILLGQIYAEMGNNEEAAKALDIYLTYVKNDYSAYLLLGQIQFENGNYEETIRAMDEVIAVDRNQREAYLYRFLSNVELGKGDAADEDRDRVSSLYPDLFEANLALIRVHLVKGRNGSALLALDQVIDLAETDEQKALAYYWGAVTHEEREEFDEAVEYWTLLLDLPEDAMTDEMQKVANEHLVDLRSSTFTPTPSP